MGIMQADDETPLYELTAEQVIAVRLKRIAESLERIATALESMNHRQAEAVNRQQTERR